MSNTDFTKKEEHTLDNGDVWIGPLKKSKPHGEGEYRFVDGGIYKGSMEKGSFHGTGTFTKKGEYTFTANFEDGEAKGKVGFKYENGDLCICTARNMKPNGTGELNSPKNTLSYKGDFKEGNFHGKGFLKAKNYTYDGEFKDNKKSGFGVEKLSYGTSYTGQFEEDKFHGYGNLNTGGINIVGEFENGLPHGTCNVTVKNRETFSAEFNKGSFFLDNVDKKNQTVLVINKENGILNSKPLEARYDKVKLVDSYSMMWPDTFISESFIKDAITKSTKGAKKKNKIKIIIEEHGSKHGKLGNQDEILNVLNKITSKVKEYNEKNEKEPVQNIDISLRSCFGSKTPTDNEDFKKVMKNFVDAGIDVTVSAGDGNFTSYVEFENGKNNLPSDKTDGYYIINKFDFNKDTNFDSIEPSKVKKFESLEDFFEDKYVGKKGETDLLLEQKIEDFSFDISPMIDHSNLFLTEDLDDLSLGESIEGMSNLPEDLDLADFSLGVGKENVLDSSQKLAEEFKKETLAEENNPLDIELKAFLTPQNIIQKSDKTSKIKKLDKQEELNNKRNFKMGR